MTENKRFQYNVNKNSIEYDGKHFAFCNGEEVKIVRKLNELAEENKQLNQEMGDLGTTHVEEINKIEDEFDEEILKLEKENEQLKSILKEMVRVSE